MQQQQKNQPDAAAAVEYLVATTDLEAQTRQQLGLGSTNKHKCNISKNEETEAVDGRGSKNWMQQKYKQRNDGEAEQKHKAITKYQFSLFNHT
ncbi:DNA topoisomerase 2-binding protein 1 isoform X2 [Sesbania bispinosa]|nr:DNA topoisomerase 2-binding protein 1 isoform X2 [Sesbania bispinosa]